MLVIFVFVLFYKAKKNKVNVRSYQKNNALLSKAERSFYGVLTKATENKAIVFTKIRVADILKPHQNLTGGRWQSAFNRISSKHFDFVLCDPQTLEILAAVELDDSSHNSKKRAQRDELLNSACQSANLDLHHFKAKESYVIRKISDQLYPPKAEKYLLPRRNENNRVEPLLNEPMIREKLSCPICSSELVSRIAKKGKHKGISFLACSAFPNCRYAEKQNT